MSTKEVNLMLRAVWSGFVLAEAPRTVWLEAHHYFPPDAVNEQYLIKSGTKRLCPWKGVATYYRLSPQLGDLLNVAWCYRHPSPLARQIKDHVAFHDVVAIEGEPDSTAAEPT